MPTPIDLYHQDHSHSPMDMMRDVSPMVLSRIYAAPNTRLGCLAFEGQGAFAPQS
jgi:hypothetical protein